jgi:hypothetical protein
MAKILEELQARAVEAKKILDGATQAFQAAQQALQTAQQNFNVWTLAVQAETREEHLRLAAATENQLPLPTAKPQTASISVAPPQSQPSESSDSGESLNKTDTVRDLLRQHPNGMSAIEIWKEVSADFKHRPYLYSVLKRLRDRDEVIMRRKKYCLKFAPKVEEGKVQPVVH